MIDIATIYTMVGEKELALDQLTRLLSIPALISVELLKIDPIWKPLHDHPRFKRMMVDFAVE